MHIPSLFHAVALQTQVNAGSLNAKSEPIHSMQTVELVQLEQLVLQAKF